MSLKSNCISESTALQLSSHDSEASSALSKVRLSYFRLVDGISRSLFLSELTSAHTHNLSDSHGWGL